MKKDPLLDAFETLMLRRPQASLIISPTRKFTVGELNALAQIIEKQVLQNRKERHQIVGISAPNGPGFLALLLGVRRAGMAALLIDHQTPPGERERIAKRIGTSTILHFSNPWPGGLDDLFIEKFSLNFQDRKIQAAIIKLSSGSTGVPRGIATGIEALLADEESLTKTMEIDPQNRLLATIPFSHSYGLSSLVLPSLVRGTILVIPDETGPFSALDAARKADATVYPTVPAYLEALIRFPEPPPFPSSLRKIISAGGPLSPKTAVSFRKNFGLPIHAFYGASECGGICFDPEGSAAERGTVGKPVSGIQIQIEDRGKGTNHKGGRVIVRSAAVAQGYVPAGNERLGKGQFITSDLGIWENGELKLVGQIEEIINVKGKKINPREIEQVLLDLPSVKDVRVFQVPRPEKKGQLVRAVIACRPGSLTSEAVLEWCRKRLSDYKIPRSIVLIESLPRTGRGKVDRSLFLDLGTKIGKGNPFHA